jgi:nucleotide-binding universal stress UspA family protein
MLKNRFKRILVGLDGSGNSIRGMNEAISLARQSDGTITGIYVLHGGLSELKNTFTHYREYLLEKAGKFMDNAKTSAARHGIDFEEKIVTSTNIVDAIANFAKSETLQQPIVLTSAPIPTLHFMFPVQKECVLLMDNGHFVNAAGVPIK